MRSSDFRNKYLAPRNKSGSKVLPSPNVFIQSPKNDILKDFEDDMTN